MTSCAPNGREAGTGPPNKSRLWPLIQQVKTTRIYYCGMLSSLHHMMLVMAKARDVTQRYSDRLANHVVTPNFSDLVPQDEQILIDEITRRAKQDLVSPEEAIARFGVKAGTEQDELNRIKAWLELKAEQQANAQPQVGGGNGGPGQAGQRKAAPDKNGPEGS